jgi:hypothetical protein
MWFLKRQDHKLFFILTYISLIVVIRCQIFHSNIIPVVLTKTFVCILSNINNQEPTNYTKNCTCTPEIDMKIPIPIHPIRKLY